MPVLTDYDRTNEWRIKAIERNKIIAKQNKQILELEQSRDDWKLCFKNLKNSLALNAKNSKDFSAKNQVAKGHCYPLFLVLFCVKYLGYGAQSFRSCVHSLLCMNLCFRLGFKKIPSHTSIRNWACKMGYYRVHKEVA
jgi:hypothetical protein